jgi:hypothetical protein
MNDLTQLAQVTNFGADDRDEIRLRDEFPDPTVQAMFLLDATKDDLLTAIEVALLNAQVEDHRGESYWQAVADVLTSQQHEN